MSAITAWMLDLAVIAVIALFTFVGVKRGFVRELANTAGWVLSLIIAYVVSPAVASVMGASVEADSEFTLLILRVAAFVLLYIVCKIVIKLIGKAINALVEKIPLVSTLNTILGGVLGAIEGGVLLVVVSMVLCLGAIAADISLPVGDTFLYRYFWELL